jgi:hypothetical protein
MVPAGASGTLPPPQMLMENSAFSYAGIQLLPIDGHPASGLSWSSEHRSLTAAPWQRPRRRGATDPDHASTAAILLADNGSEQEDA